MYCRKAQAVFTVNMSKGHHQWTVYVIKRKRKQNINGLAHYKAKTKNI